MFRNKESLSFAEKIPRLSFGLIILIIIIATIGTLALYSAANGSWQPWALKHAIRFAIGFCGMMVVAFINIKWWLKLSYPAYIISLLLLLAVEIKGHIGMGAQRWIDLGFMRLQPSEIMKITTVMALARIFHSYNLEDIKNPFLLVRPLILVILPAALVLVQPDLGTALIIIMVSGAMFFLAGVPLWMFGAVIALALATAPLFWNFAIKDYQKQRILTFLNPENDPLGAGYHITQSKIALGSGGIKGKGFLQGTQSHLNFLPEKQTDFIFTLMAEEWGFLGGITLFVIFSLVIMYGFLIAKSSYNHYGRLLSAGITVNFALYVFINIAMVMGLIPVVGVPLPMVSNGGSAMLAVLFGFGLILSVRIHREFRFARKL